MYFELSEGLNYIEEIYKDLVKKYAVLNDKL